MPGRAGMKADEMWKRIGVVVFVFCMLAGVARADGDVLAALRPGHPRLVVLDEDLKRVRGLIEADAAARHWHELLVAEAKHELKSKPVERVLIGPRLLDKS